MNIENYGERIKKVNAFFRGRFCIAARHAVTIRRGEASLLLPRATGVIFDFHIRISSMLRDLKFFNYF